MREAYRLNKTFFDTALLQENHRLEVAFIYVKDELTNYADIEKAVVKALGNITQQLTNRENEK